MLLRVFSWYSPRCTPNFLTIGGSCCCLCRSKISFVWIGDCAFKYTQALWTQQQQKPKHKFILKRNAQIHNVQRDQPRPCQNERFFAWKWKREKHTNTHRLLQIQWWQTHHNISTEFQNKGNEKKKSLSLVLNVGEVVIAAKRGRIDSLWRFMLLLLLSFFPLEFYMLCLHSFFVLCWVEFMRAWV